MRTTAPDQHPPAQICGNCRRRKAGTDKEGVVMAKHGFELCESLPSYHYLSAGASCHFRPSQFVPRVAA